MDLIVLQVQERAVGAAYNTVDRLTNEEKTSKQNQEEEEKKAAPEHV